MKKIFPVALTIFLLLITVGIPLFFFSCKKEKDEEKVDLYSMPSTNKLTCKIDGKNWEATEISYGFCLAPPDKQYFRLYAYKDNTNEAVEIYFNKPYSILARKFNLNTPSWYRTSWPADNGLFSRYLGNGNSEGYITNETDTGYCTITYMDSVNFRIKGVFAFKARDENTNKTVTITDGYFERTQR